MAPPSHRSAFTSCSLRRCAQRLGQVDPSVVANHLDRGLGLRRFLVGRREDHDPPLPFGEQRRVPGQVEAPGDDHHERVRREAELLPLLALVRIGDDAAVPLGAHRPCADHHRIRPGSQADQELGVPVATDLARDSVDRRVAVQGEGEVHEDVRPVGRRVLPRAELVDQLGDGDVLGGLGQEAAHGRTVPI